MNRRGEEITQILVANCRECDTTHAIGLLPTLLTEAAQIFGKPCPTCQSGSDKLAIGTLEDLIRQWDEHLTGVPMDSPAYRAKRSIEAVLVMFDALDAREKAGRNG